MGHQILGHQKKDLKILYLSSSPLMRLENYSSFLNNYYRKMRN
jgi:hypothetical protein